MAREVRLEESWRSRLAGEFDAAYMQALRAFVLAEMNAGKTVYPPPEAWFAALDSTPFDDVKVVIIGQDPYHGPGQAHGLCFSVQPGVPVPPSLVNIFKEIDADLGIKAPPGTGYLADWANQGVLLLNSVLTVERQRAGSHQGQGWETFTDRVVELVASEKEHVAFLLWGSYAQKKGAGIDRSRHLVLTAPHPSPLSAHRGFFGCRHFSRCNQWLEEQGLAPIDWRLSPPA